MSQMVESRTGAVAWGRWPTLRFPSPLIEPDVPISGIRLSDWFHREAHGQQTNRTRFRYGEQLSFAPRHSNLPRRLSLMVLAGSSPITTTSPSSKAHQKSGSFPQPALPGFDGRTTLSDSRHGRRLRDVEAATLTLDGSPPITRTTLPTCRAHYPGGSRGCACRLLPHACGLPQMTGGSASALELSRPAQASLCYGPSDRSAAQGRLRRRAPPQPVTRPGRLPASGPIDNYPGEILPHW